MTSGASLLRLTYIIKANFESVILSYRDKRTKDFAEGKRVRDFEGIRQQAEKRLDILEAATSLTDLLALPSNALEGLKGDRKGQYSIRINMQWRICFQWPAGQSGPRMSRSLTITESY
ncbi:MAG TPA: type II toxin-antitoxin system RelE/ParE family toxin [Casimicrobiaceae bacterium]|nr:type II toxin-antitoxin system RelE/ParE family toxin [Casimicrobiaceae bacterium]